MNKHNRRQIYLWAVPAFLTLISFQNCGRLAVNSDLVTGSQNFSSESVELISKGTEVWNNRCATCHDSIGVTAKRGRSISQIQSSLASVGQMRFLEALVTREDIEALSMALKGPPATPPPTSPPLQITIAQPAALSLVPNTFQVSGLCPADLSLQASGNLLSASVSGLCSASGQFQLTLQTAAMAPEEGAIRIDVLDNSGASVASASLQLMIDRTAPLLSVTEPPAASQISGTVTIAGACEGSLDVRISGTALTAALVAPCSSGSYRVTSPVVATPGSRTILAQSVDSAGNQAMSQVNVQVMAVDVTDLLSLTFPTPGASVGAVWTIRGACETGATLEFILTRQNLTETQACVGGAYNRNMAARVTTDGEQSLTVRQIVGGRTTMRSVTFQRDTTAPILSIVSPTMNTSYSGTVQVSGMCENGLAVMISGSFIPQPVTATCTAGSYSRSFSLTGILNQQTLRVEQVDAIGNLGQRNVTFNVMAPAPTYDGVALYSARCQRCHNPLDRSQVRGFSASNIQSAIRNVGDMRSLSVLLPEEVAAIATALARP